MSLTKWQDCNRRLLRALAWWLGLLVAGICYGAVVARTGFGIPCLFRLATGLQCPGCGITHMALCLMRGDLSGAFHANAMVLTLLPVGMILAAKITLRYLKTGLRQLTRWENRTVIGMIVLLIGFGVIRNLAFFS